MSKDVERKEKTVEERARNEVISNLRTTILITVFANILTIQMIIKSSVPIGFKVFLLLMWIAALDVFIIKQIKDLYYSTYNRIKKREYVKDNLSQSYVKVEPKSDSKFILDLKNRVKFYAQYNEEEEIVLISVKYNGEEQYIPFEKVCAQDFTKKYQIAEKWILWKEVRIFYFLLFLIYDIII